MLLRTESYPPSDTRNRNWLACGLVDTVQAHSTAADRCVRNNRISRWCPSDESSSKLRYAQFYQLNNTRPLTECPQLHSIKCRYLKSTSPQIISPKVVRRAAINHSKEIRAMAVNNKRGICCQVCPVVSSLFLSDSFESELASQ